VPKLKVERRRWNRRVKPLRLRERPRKQIALRRKKAMTTTAWNLADLRAHIRSTQAEPLPALEIVSSIDRSVRIFRYHMTTARDALKGVVNEVQPSGKENLLLVLGASEQQDEFEYAKVVSEAHLIGCLHTARGLWDLLAQLLNSTAIQTPLPISVCDIAKVATALPDSPLKVRVNELLSSQWYRYVSAFINTTKHRQLVQHMLSVSFAEDRAGICVGAFTYGGTTFDAYWGTQVLEGAIEVKNGIIACGRLLNQVVLARDV
jgi:hypothetical protein